MMVVPVDRNVDEAQNIAQKHWQQFRKGGSICTVRNLQLKNHNRDDDGDDAIAECGQTLLWHGSASLVPVQPMTEPCETSQRHACHLGGLTVHTIMVIAGGLALLAACLIVGRFVATVSKGALAFLPLWLIGAGLNMWIGVTRAGYPISAELPIFLLVFGVPAALALCAWRYFNGSSSTRP